MARKPKLEEYRAKRNFQITPEPPPSEAAKASPTPTFMVHKHDATRLHYDLRLEMDGALASWAIPKGPSYDPEAKRLAVQTEDHPLEYGSFEGRIPDGEYGAGDSIIWDRGTYDTEPPGQASEQRRKGHLKIRLSGEKLNGLWHLVRTRPLGGKAQWLCFKGKDGTENAAYDVVAERPESVATGRRVTRGPVRQKNLRAIHPRPDKLLEKLWPPMLATLSQEKKADVDETSHLFELKYDGYRGIAAVSGGKVAFLTRNGIDLTGRFPRIARALERLKLGEVVVDGEIVALDASGVSRFQSLMTDEAEERFVIFDLLWLDGEDLRKRPLEERRDLLESVLANTGAPLQISQRVDMPLGEALAWVKRQGGEGLIAKRRGSPYVGTRSKDWLKLKVQASQEVAIVGFTPMKNGTDGLGALLLGVQGAKGMEFAGKVGTGFSSKVRKELRRVLEKDVLEKAAVAGAPRMRDARWVKPKLVAQVTFTEWTRDGKLRHPSFQGLREDKKPEECTREKPVEVKGSKAAPQAKAARHLRLVKEEEPKKARAEPVLLSSPQKLLYPKSGISKGDVFKYYQEMAPVMLPAVRGRPLTLQQWPRGIEQPGYFRQEAPNPPDWITTVAVEHERREVNHVVVDREETLAWLANQNALTLHTWMSRVPHLKEPDWVVFDLDPGKGGWASVIEVAHALHRFLEELGLDSVPKTSGKRGLHVVVPIARGHTYRDIGAFAETVANALASVLPKVATTERSIAKRGGRLYLDAMQNGFGKTVVAPYTLRAVEGAPASTPLRWSEVSESLNPLDFTLKTLPRRVEKVGDLFAPALNATQRLPRV